MWGVMAVVHADNAKEFHGRMLHKAAENYGIDVQWRPWLGPIMAAILSGCWGPSTMTSTRCPAPPFPSDRTRRL